jgi:hypothetical protein
MLELIAKLLCLEKLMILRPVASGTPAATVQRARSTTGGLIEENERKSPQKGDFAWQMSFAIGSFTILQRNSGVSGKDFSERKRANLQLASLLWLFLLSCVTAGCCCEGRNPCCPPPRVYMCRPKCCPQPQYDEPCPGQPSNFIY